MSSVALVAGAGQRELLSAIAQRVPVVGALGRGRGRIAPTPFPVFGTLDALLRPGPPSLVCFLVPYAGLLADVAACLERGIHVRCAGPVPGTPRGHAVLAKAAVRGGASLRWGGVHRHSPLYRRLREQRHRPAFGRPVYLRSIAGGGSGVLAAWWAASEALAMAEGLIGDAPRDLQVAARADGSAIDLAVSALAGRAIAHLLVAPAFPGAGDVLLVGTGGLLSSEPWNTPPALLGAASVGLRPLPDLLPEPAWLDACLTEIAGPAPPVPDYPARDARLLRGIRQAVRSAGLVAVDTPT